MCNPAVNANRRERGCFLTFSPDREFLQSSQTLWIRALDGLKMHLQPVRLTVWQSSRPMHRGYSLSTPPLPSFSVMASSITQPSISHQSPIDVDDADGVGVWRLTAPKAAATRQQQAMPATATVTAASGAAAAAWVQPVCEGGGCAMV